MLYERSVSLDPRLTMIADLLGTCVCCADIGSDHGRLGAFLLQNHRCERMVLTDISAPSLEKARRLIALAGLEARVEFAVGDGARALTMPVDAAVIAGMGGDTIGKIIEESADRLNGARLVLQPNVAVAQLRARLNACGWRIEDEALVRDGRRIYNVIVAAQGEQSLTPAEATVGPVLLAKRPPLLRDYAQFRLRVARKALMGAQKGGDARSAEGLQCEIAVWEDVEACL